MLVFCTVFLMMAQSVFCSASVGEFCVEKELSGNSYLTSYYRAPRGIESDEAIVQFKNEGKLYQVRWDTFCAMYTMTTSVQMILERTLLNGDDQASFVCAKTEASVMLTRDVRSLKSCLKQGKRISYDGLDGLCLKEKHVESMFPVGQTKRWQILPLSYDKDLSNKEVRVLFSEGGLSCVPTNEDGLGDFLIPLNSRRYVQAKAEDATEFSTGLQRRAEEELFALQEAAQKEEGVVEMRYVNQNNEESFAAFCGDSIHDDDMKDFSEFLLYCVLQGTFQGYLDEAKKHYAFVNESLCEAIKDDLASCIAQDCQVKSVGNKPRVPESALRSLPPMAWIVVPKGSFRCPREANTISFTFAGVSLEGRPLVDDEPCVSGMVARSYLWALFCDEFDKPDEGVCQFSWRCASMLWNPNKISLS